MKNGAERVEALLCGLEPDSRRRKVRRAVDDYFADPRRRDALGRRRPAELKKVATTLGHIVGMQRWATNERYDLNVRRQIRKFLKHVDHNQPWHQSVVECSTARGLVNKAGQAVNERQEFFTGKPEVLGDAHRCHPLNSIAELRAGGRRGGNCLRDNDYEHHDELREGEAEFYEIRRDGVPVAWLRVDCDRREVTTILGPRNEDAEIPAEVLHELCLKLEVTGDNHELFHCSGVLSMFVHGSADSDVPTRVVGGYEFWWRRGEIAMRDSRDGRWSRFLCRGRRWREARHSDLNAKAFEALRRVSPKIGLIALSALPTRGRKPRLRPRC